MYDFCFQKSSIYGTNAEIAPRRPQLIVKIDLDLYQKSTGTNQCSFGPIMEVFET